MRRGSPIRRGNLLKSNNVALCVAETEDDDHTRGRDGWFVYYRFRKPSYTGRNAGR
jgi:hypothetical protein